MNYKPNDVLFLVNPYGAVNQTMITIETFVVTKVDELDKCLHGLSSSFLEPNVYRRNTHFIPDMESNIKGVFTDIEEALVFLAQVHNNKFKEEVDRHHNEVSKLFSIGATQCI